MPSFQPGSRPLTATSTASAAANPPNPATKPYDGRARVSERLSEARLVLVADSFRAASRPSCARFPRAFRSREARSVGAVRVAVDVDNTRLDRARDQTRSASFSRPGNARSPDPTSPAGKAISRSIPPYPARSTAPRSSFDRPPAARPVVPSARSHHEPNPPCPPPGPSSSFLRSDRPPRVPTPAPAPPSPPPPRSGLTSTPPTPPPRSATKPMANPAAAAAYHAEPADRPKTATRKKPAHSSAAAAASATTPEPPPQPTPTIPMATGSS